MNTKTDKYAHGEIDDLCEARITAGMAKEYGLHGIYPSSCVVLDMALTDAYAQRDKLLTSLKQNESLMRSVAMNALEDWIAESGLAAADGMRALIAEFEQ